MYKPEDSTKVILVIQCSIADYCDTQGSLGVLESALGSLEVRLDVVEDYANALHLRLSGDKEDVAEGIHEIIQTLILLNDFQFNFTCYSE